MWGLVPPKQSIPSDHWWPGQGRTASSLFHSRANSGAVATEGLWMWLKTKLDQPWPWCFTKSKYAGPWNTSLGGPSLLFCHGSKEQTFWSWSFFPPVANIFNLPLAKCSFLFLRKEAERAFWRPHRQSQKASWTANNSERTTIWWVKCKWIRDIWITFLGKYTWAYNVKQGSEWWGSGEENALKNVVWVLPIAKCLKQIIWDVLPSLEHGWIHPFLLLRCHFQTRHTR